MNLSNLQPFLTSSNRLRMFGFGSGIGLGLVDLVEQKNFTTFTFILSSFANLNN